MPLQTIQKRERKKIKLKSNWKRYTPNRSAEMDFVIKRPENIIKKWKWNKTATYGMKTYLWIRKKIVRLNFCVCAKQSPSNLSGKEYLFLICCFCFVLLFFMTNYLMLDIIRDDAAALQLICKLPTKIKQIRTTFLWPKFGIAHAICASEFHIRSESKIKYLQNEISRH